MATDELMDSTVIKRAMSRRTLSRSQARYGLFSFANQFGAEKPSFVPVDGE
jgi:hypothetical protein